MTNETRSTANLETRNFAISKFEVRAKSEESEGRAKGYAAVFNSESLYIGWIERIAPGAFARSLADAAAGDLNIYALWAHRDDCPLGSTGSGKLLLTEDETGLYFEMDTKRMTAAQLDALRDGDLRMSFGFYAREEQWAEDDAGNVERTLIDVDLSEVSFVISPAYPDTSAALRSMEAWRSASKTDSTETTEVESNDTMAKRHELKRRILTKRAK